MTPNGTRLANSSQVRQLARGGKTGNEPDQAEDHAHDEPPPWLDDLPIRLKALLLG